MGDTVNGEYNISNAMTGLAQMGQMGIQNALTRQQMTQNALAIQQAQSQRAAGADFQKAIDPATGQFSPAKYNQLLAADPGAAFAASGASQAGVTNQGGVLNNQAQQVSNRNNNIKFMANVFTGYQADPSSVTPKQFQSDMTDFITNGGDPSVAANILSTAPAPGSPQWAPFVKNEFTHLSGAAGQIGNALPQATPINAGGQIIMGQGNALTPGYTAPGSVVTSSPSPEFMSTPQTVQTGAGAVTGTPAQLGIATPAASITPPGGTMRPGYGPQGLAAIGGAQGQPAPAAAPQGAAGPLAAGPVSNLAGAQASNASLATDQMGAYSSDVQRASNTAPILSSITELAAAAKGFTPGPLASQIAQVNSMAAELGLPTSTDSAGAEQTASKAAGMILAQNLTGFGASTDAKLGAAMGITPNGTMSGEGLAATAALTAGAQLYQLRLGQAAQQWQGTGGNPSDPVKGYNAFKMQFQNQTSPLVLAIPYMTPSQKRDLATEIKTLPGAQQRAIEGQVQASAKNGWLGAPGQ